MLDDVLMLRGVRHRTLCLVAVDDDTVALGEILGATVGVEVLLLDVRTPACRREALGVLSGDGRPLVRTAAAKAWRTAVAQREASVGSGIGPA